MFEKVNPDHPDKVADRIAGAIVDLAYQSKDAPKVAAEVLIGHDRCFVIVESDIKFSPVDIDKIVQRITGRHYVIQVVSVEQDASLSANQKKKIRCGDNGIFRGTPTTAEQKTLTNIARDIYSKYTSDGKYILNDEDLIICQSNAKTEDLQKDYPTAKINPLGDWTGGPDTDAGATNRKLGSDMGDSITGGGLHGKDLSKADVSVNIYAHLKAQETGEPVELYCAIGDEEIDGRPYSEIVEIARDYIDRIGGFEKFAEWGLIQ